MSKCKIIKWAVKKAKVFFTAHFFLIFAVAKEPAAGYNTGIGNRGERRII